MHRQSNREKQSTRPMREANAAKKKAIKEAEQAYEAWLEEKESKQKNVRFSFLIEVVREKSTISQEQPLIMSEVKTVGRTKKHADSEANHGNAPKSILKSSKNFTSTSSRPKKSVSFSNS